MNKIFNKDVLKKVLIFFILLQPLLDTYVLFDETTMSIFKISPSTVIRLLFIAVIGILAIFTIKSKKQWFWYGIYAFASIIYTIFHIYNAMQFQSLTPGNFNFSPFNEIFYIIRMIIPLFLLVLTANLKITKDKFIKTVNILILLTAGVIVITNILKISIGAYITKPIEYNFFDWFIQYNKNFSVYDIATRGYFSFANMISCVLFGFNAIIYYQFYKNQNSKTIFLIIIQLLATFMLGTKVATLGFILSTVIMFVIYLFFCFIQKELKFKPKVVFIILTIIISWWLIYPFSPCNTRETTDSEINEKEETSEEENNKYLIQTNELLLTLSEEEKNEYLVDFTFKNYKRFSIKEDYILNKYPYNYDPVFWYSMFSEPFYNKSNNRCLTTKILDRIKELNGNKISDELFGITYSRMSNINILERDFVSQYYTLGIVGSLLFTLPFILIIIIGGCVLIAMNYKNKTLNIYNVSLLFCISSCFFGAYYCGNSLDNLTLSIIYSFICGYFIRQIVEKKNYKLKEKEVTILALHLGYGGVEQYISSLCKMLKEDYKINIICTYKINNKPAFEFDEKINIKYLINEKPNKEEFKLAIKNRNVINIIREGLKSLKIIFLKYYKNIQAISKINSKYIITTRIFHNKLVQNYADDNVIKIATEHNFHNNDKKYISKVVNSVKYFNYFVPVSNTLKEFYKTKIKHTKVLCIPNVIEVSSSELSKLKNNVLINVGRMEKEKAQEELIEIVYDLKKDIKDIKLYLIGDGSLRKLLEEKVKKYKLEENVIFTGFISRQELKDYYLKSKLFIMTSITESFGLVLLEAQEYGVPCIAFDSADGAKELLKNENGVLIKNRNRAEMKKKILSLLTDNKTLKELQKNGKNNSAKYYINNIKQDWLNLLGGEHEKDI